MITPNFKKFKIEAYKPGKSKVKKLKNVIKLSANESALGMSPKAKKIISNINLNLDKYPDGKSQNLRKAISKAYKCNSEKIICGAGSDEVIQMLCQLFLNPKDEVVVPEYSFLMYRIYSKIVGAKVVFAKEINFKVSVKEILKKITKKTKIVFIANPNNPTGTYLTKKEVLELRKRLNKKILLVIDDAYAEYMKNKDYSSGLDLFKNKENVKIIDSSWHLPNEKKDSFVEYNFEHIPNSVYFDIDTNSDQNSDLPHMLPEKNRWEEIMSDLGISNKDNIIIYCS